MVETGERKAGQGRRQLESGGQLDAEEGAIDMAAHLYGYVA